MKTWKRNAGVLAAVLVAAGCQKDEIPVAPFDRGEATIAQVSMGPLYRDQVWYSLERNEVASVNALTDWDVAFGQMDDVHHLYLNEARLMQAWRSGYTTIEAAADSSGFGQGKRTEVAMRYRDRRAVDPWSSDERPVLLIDLGFSETGAPLGLHWLEVSTSGPGGYSFRSKTFGGDEITAHSLETDPQRKWTRYSLLEASLLPTAPPDSEWDVVFSKYTFAFDNPPMDYLVTGALCNPAGAQAIEVSDRAYADIDLAYAEALEFSPRIDEIGYDWKTYNFDIARFTTDSERSYVLRGIGGLYFKLRFTDFYDGSGHAGAPQWEFEIL